MSDSIYNLVIFVSTLASVLIGYLFDVPAPILWAAAIGSGFGVAFSEPTKPWYAFLWILTGTVITGFAAPIITHMFEMPLPVEKGVAFFMALGIIGFRASLRSRLHGLLDVIFGRLARFIDGGK